jgi:hypothetical protein
MRLVLSARPSPSQTPHGFSMIWPTPRQRGQVCETWKNPRELMTCPRPPQAGQLMVREPGSAPFPSHFVQTSSLRTSISLSTPNAASSSVICMS